MHIVGQYSMKADKRKLQTILDNIPLVLGMTAAVETSVCSVSQINNKQKTSEMSRIAYYRRKR